jgi:hypothetical protein
MISQQIFERTIDGSLCSPLRLSFSNPSRSLPFSKELKEILNDFLADDREVFPLSRNPIFFSSAVNELELNLKSAENSSSLSLLAGSRIKSK